MQTTIKNMTNRENNTSNQEDIIKQLQLESAKGKRE